MSVRIIDHSEEVREAIDRQLDDALDAIGVHIEGEATDALEMKPRRVDTGLLRNSIAYALSGQPANISTYTSDDGSKSGSYSGTAPDDPPNKKAVYIGTNVEYAIYVSEGTQKMTPNRFLKNAVELNKDQIKGYIEDALKNG